MNDSQRCAFSIGALRCALGVSVVFACLATASSAGAAQYTVASFTWDDDNTPDNAGLLGNGQVLGGATFSSGLPTGAGSSNGVGFPDFSGASNYLSSGSVFDTTLTLGRNTGLASTANSSRFVNLPNGNNGTSIRHGVEVSWSGGRMLPNLPGADFAIYESASSSSQVEHPMVRVRDAVSSTWSDWHYFPPSAFELYVGNANEGTMAAGYDLSSFGIAGLLAIDGIQLANLISTDRIDGSITHSSGGQDFGVGRVVFDSSTTIKPDAGSLAGGDRDTGYTSSTLDPDPLYVASLHNVVTSLIPEPGTALLALCGVLALATSRRQCAGRRQSYAAASGTRASAS